MAKVKAKTSPKTKNKPALKKVAKKVTKTKKEKAKTIGDIWNPNQKLTMAEELFCRYYVLNEETRRNATRSYDLAYDKNLDEQPKDDAVYATIPSSVEGGLPEKKLVTPSSYDKCHNVCSTEGNKLLRKPEISQRITKLLNELMTDEFVDGELVKVISQDHDLKPKVTAIGEYNKLRKRTTTSVIEHTHSFAKFEGMTDDELEKELANGEKFFKKT